MTLCDRLHGRQPRTQVQAVALIGRASPTAREADLRHQRLELRQWLASAMLGQSGQQFVHPFIGQVEMMQVYMRPARRRWRQGLNVTAQCAQCVVAVGCVGHGSIAISETCKRLQEMVGWWVVVGCSYYP